MGHGAITAKGFPRGLKEKLQEAGFEERKQSKAWEAAGNRLCRSLCLGLLTPLHQTQLHSCCPPYLKGSVEETERGGEGVRRADVAVLCAQHPAGLHRVPYSHPFITCLSSNLERIHSARDSPVSVSPELRL